MSRNAEEGFSLYEELFTKGVNLVFLKEPHINTDTFIEGTDSQHGNLVPSFMPGVLI